MGNKVLHKARRRKRDEFYTQMKDIEKEVINYKEQLKNKVIYLNCDKPIYIEDGDDIKFNHKGSSFFKFFYLNFEEFKLKKLITTFYDDENPVYKTEYTGGGINGIKKTLLSGNGDFRSNEAIECLKEADIVCTNPPFSMFREYINQLMEYEKKFLVMGHLNAVNYINIAPLLEDGKIYVGYNANKATDFRLPNHYEKWTKMDEHGIKYGEVPGITWYTNICTNRKYKYLPLDKKYYGNEDEYKKYDNYDAININRVKDIPYDYYGTMGVPISFMSKYNPEQFKIIRIRNPKLCVDGKIPYSRILIKRRSD